jgi:hypothetical protein
VNDKETITDMDMKKVTNLCDPDTGDLDPNLPGTLPPDTGDPSHGITSVILCNHTPVILAAFPTSQQGIHVYICIIYIYVCIYIIYMHVYICTYIRICIFPYICTSKCH